MQTCKYGCGKQIVFRMKDPDIPHDTGFRELDGTPHTYSRCRALLVTQAEMKQKLEQFQAENSGGLESFGVEV